MAQRCDFGNRGRLYKVEELSADEGRRFNFLVSLLFVIGPRSGAAPQTIKRLPVLCFITFDPEKSPRFSAFFKGLEDLGYINGKNIELLYLSADDVGGRYPELIDECLSHKPDIIATTTTPAALLLKQATKTVPIVMVALGDPLGTNLVDSLSRPSENITGM